MGLAAFNRMRREQAKKEAQENGENKESPKTTKSQLILEALGKLDHGNDDHWTKKGLPEMNVVEQLMGDSSITRKDIDEAAPDFKREK